MTTLIKNVTIIDGSGTAPFVGDILVRDGEIMAVGRFPTYRADRVVQGNEAYACPGFIDSNASSDRYLTLFSSPIHKNFLEQGITSIVIGQCGFSLAPSLYGPLRHMSDWAKTGMINSDWQTTKEFLNSLEKSFSFGVNIATLTGHKVIREDLIKDPRTWRALTENELKIFRSVLLSALAEGSFGLSTGLGYYPYQQTTQHELQTLADVVARAKGLYATHIRDEKMEILESVQETIRITHDTSVRTLINHLRPFYGYEGEFEKALELIESRASDIPLYFLTNPFTYSVVPLDTFLPDDMKEMERDAVVALLSDKKNVARVVKQIPRLEAKNTIIVHAPEMAFLNGVSLYDFAAHRDLDASHALVELIRMTKTKGFIFYENLNQAVLSRALVSPRALIATNSFGADVAPKFYPERARASFTKFLQEMSRSSISLESTIARVTGIAAEVIGISKRGRLQSGYAADIVLLSRDFTPIRVWVNGVPVVEEGVVTARVGEKYGKILRRI
jgi:N-acyl-D-amino-acid deacylase